MKGYTRKDGTYVPLHTRSCPVPRWRLRARGRNGLPSRAAPLARRGATGPDEPVLSDLPDFPDNVTRGLDGRFWVALISPRSGLVDMLADKPRVRTALLRLPGFLLPEPPAHYSHVIAFDATGRVLASAPPGRSAAHRVDPTRQPA